jgi:hypothetical protein
MGPRREFYLLSPDGRLSLDIFVLADEQRRAIKPGCVLIVHPPTGRLLTVHETRLFPVGPTVFARHPAPWRSACLRCGRVEGVVDDQVACPVHGGASCGLVESAGAGSADRSPPIPEFELVPGHVASGVSPSG